MPDLDKLVYHVADALEKRTEPPEEKELVNLIRAHAAVLSLTEGGDYSPKQIEEATRRIQTQFDTRMGLGTIFEAEDYKPWLFEERGKTDWYYWRRYENYLKREGFSPNVVRSLGLITDEILNHLENPRKEGRWARRGLVVGHVHHVG